MQTSARYLQSVGTPGESTAENILALLDENNLSDKRWRASIFRFLPKRFARTIALEYKENYIFEGRRQANLALLTHDEQFKQCGIQLDATDNDLAILAKHCIREMQCLRKLYRCPETLLEQLINRAKKYGIRTPVVNHTSITLHGACNRFFDEGWWLRVLRKTHAKNLEHGRITRRPSSVHPFCTSILDASPRGPGPVLSEWHP